MTEYGSRLPVTIVIRMLTGSLVTGGRCSRLASQIEGAPIYSSEIFAAKLAECASSPSPSFTAYANALHEQAAGATRVTGIAVVGRSRVAA